MPRLTPRVSQLRQEECADVASREVNHEREVHTALQISQSWEDLTLDAENWSFKSDNSSDLTNPLHVTLPTGITSCSSPSPTRCVYLSLFFIPLKLRILQNFINFFGFLQFNFECLVVELDYDLLHMDYHHLQPEEHFKQDDQCLRLRCDQVHWVQLNENLN